MERTIRHGLFRYYQLEEQVISGEEKAVLVERMAFHNQTVDIPRVEDLERGERLGAFWTPSEAIEHYARLGIPAPELGSVGGATALAPAAAPADTAGAEEIELTDLDDEELVDWLMSTGRFDGEPKPTVPDVVGAAEGDKAFAERLLKAEKTASGDAVRAGVEEGLQKVITE